MYVKIGFHRDWGLKCQIQGFTTWVWWWWWLLLCCWRLAVLLLGLKWRRMSWEEEELQQQQASFSSPSPLLLYRHHQQHCALCFNPSATRCSRCKSVRYCSSKCQIIHWRQGHKLECRPFTTNHQNIYTGEVPSGKFLVPENEIYGSDIENEERNYARNVQSALKESPFSTSEGKAVGRNDDSEVEHHLDRDEKGSNLHKTEKSDKVHSTTDLPAKLKSNHVKNIDRKWVPCLGKPVKSGCTKSNSLTTSLSGSFADGSNNSSFSEPFTLSSGFGDQIIDPRQTKLDAHDDSSQFISSDADMCTSESSPDLKISFCWNIPPVNKQNSSPEIFQTEGAQPPNKGMKKAIYRIVTSEDKIGDASKRKGLPSWLPENSDCINGHLSNESPVLKRDPQSCNPYTTPSIMSRLMSLGADKSNDVGDTSSTLHTDESKESKIFASNISIANSSNTITCSREGTKPLKVGCAHVGGVCSDYGNHSLKARNGFTPSTCTAVDNFRVSNISTHHRSTAGGEVAGRYTNKGLFSYDVFVELYNWNTIEMRPCGLTNCGNSCYANAVLQCLAFTQPLTAYLLQGLHSKACEKKKWCFTCEFESLIMKVREGISPVTPIRILFEIQKSGSCLGNGREEDAHEFLRYAIDNLQTVCLKDARTSEPSSLEEETTLIGLTFGGYLRSKIKCMRCGSKSERHERMMDLTVEIEGDIGTLETALRKFTGTEILDGENKYQCSRCRSYEKAKKKLKVQEAPNVLTIALKRFQSGKFGKLNKSIQFPEILDLAPYMSGTSDKSPIYKLYGVVVHLDVMNATFSGHYVCYVKNLQNKWFKVDDSVVTDVERVEVLSKRAYMLLYARCSPRAPRLIRKSIIPPDPRKAKNPLIKPRSLSTCPWDEPSDRHNGIDCLYPNNSNLPHNRRILEDDSASEISSSLFSEVCSCSTESSNRDSSSTDEFSDHLFGDSDQNWNTMWKHSSDSDTSSSSPSSSPALYTKWSPLSHSDKYSSHDQNGGPDKDDDGFGARSSPFLNYCTTKH